MQVRAVLEGLADEVVDVCVLDEDATGDPELIFFAVQTPALVLAVVRLFFI